MKLTKFPLPIYSCSALLMSWIATTILQLNLYYKELGKIHHKYGGKRLSNSDDTSTSTISNKLGSKPGECGF